MIPLFALAHFAHHVMNALLIPLTPYIREELGLNYAQAGGLAASFTVAYGLAQLPAGWLSDRIGRRILLLIGISGVAAAGALIGLAVNYWMIVGALLLMGVLGGGYHPSASSTISARVAPEKRGKALGVHIIGGSSTHFLAPLIAAGAVGLLGWRGTFVALSIPAFLLGLLLYVLLRRHTEGRPSRKPAATANHVGDDEARDQNNNDDDKGNKEDDHPSRPVGHIVVFLILTGVISVAAASSIAFIPLMLIDRYGAGEELSSALLAIVYSAGFWAAPLGGHLSDRLGHTPVMIVTGLLTGPAVVMLAFSGNLIGACITMVFLGLFMFTKMPTAESYIAHSVPNKIRATVLGIYFFSGMEGAALLTPLLGALIDSRGFGVGMLVMGGSTFLIAVICSILLRNPKWAPRVAASD